jgi:uncharacterized DUF497 family protein
MFIWDTKKAISNFEKHGVSFEQAATVFNDERGLELHDIKHSQREARYARFGRSANGRILTVIFTIRTLSDGKETTRIISARQASRQERAAYFRY